MLRKLKYLVGLLLLSPLLPVVGLMYLAKYLESQPHGDEASPWSARCSIQI